MEKKKLQKVFYFSSETNKKLIESVLSDESEITTRYMSNLMEDHILHDLMPDNAKSAYFAKMLYADPPVETGNIRFVLVALFNTFSAICDFNAIPENAKDIVEYTRDNFVGAMREKFIPDNAGTGQYMISACESVINRLEYIHANETLESQEKLLLSQDINSLKSIIRNGYADWGRDYTCFVFSCISDHWKYLGTDTYTYRLLSSLTSLIPIQETVEQRFELLNLLKQCKHWDRED